jgi:hypothetical protein
VFRERYGVLVSSPTPVAAAAGSGRRHQASLGGLVPSAAVARGGETLVMALCVEVHAEGAVLPLLVLSDAPGLLGWDPAQGLTVRDEGGREYEVDGLSQQVGIGALQATVWIEPAPPPGARRLLLCVDGLARTSAARGGGGIARTLTGGPWELEIDLVPARTAVEPPSEPRGRPSAGRPARVPSRTLAGFEGLVPVGQARVTAGVAVCVWALERYRDRAVLSVGILAEEPVRVGPLTAGAGQVDVWDDRGNRYVVAPVHGAAHPGWSESSLEVVPAIRSEARALAVRLSELPRHGPAPADRGSLPGPFLFGVGLSAPDV